MGFSDWIKLDPANPSGGASFVEYALDTMTKFATSSSLRCTIGTSSTIARVYLSNSGERGTIHTYLRVRPFARQQLFCRLTASDPNATGGYIFDPWGGQLYRVPHGSTKTAWGLTKTGATLLASGGTISGSTGDWLPVGLSWAKNLSDGSVMLRCYSSSGPGASFESMAKVIEHNDGSALTQTPLGAGILFSGNDSLLDLHTDETYTYSEAAL